MTAKTSTVLRSTSAPPRSSTAAPSSRTAWRFLGWFGLSLAVIGFGQLALNFYPALAFGSPEWEFATIAVTIGGLPLATMGLAGLVAAAVANGSRRGMIAVAIVLLLLCICVAVALGMFLTVVPLALRAPPEVAAGVRQSIAKTLWMGSGFGFLYLTAGVGVLRHLKRSARRPNA